MAHIRSKIVVPGEADKPFRCDPCSLTFVNLGNLNRHRREKHGENQHKCDVCGFVASRIDNLRRHMNKHIKSGAVSASPNPHLSPLSEIYPHNQHGYSKEFLNRLAQDARGPYAVPASPARIMPPPPSTDPLNLNMSIKLYHHPCHVTDSCCQPGIVDVFGHGRS